MLGWSYKTSIVRRNAIKRLADVAFLKAGAVAQIPDLDSVVIRASCERY
jgi:hypothetical protein